MIVTKWLHTKGWPLYRISKDHAKFGRAHLHFSEVDALFGLFSPFDLLLPSLRVVRGALATLRADNVAAPDGSIFIDTVR